MSLAITHAARHGHPYRRLEDRPGADARPDDRRGALPRARRRGRAGADLRFHQCACAKANRRPNRRSARACARSSRTPTGRVAITTFSSNVGRIRSIAEAARDAGRAGAGARPLAEARHRCRERTRLSWTACQPSSPRRTTAIIPRENLVVICTGSQGEPRAALAKLARDEMRNVALAPGDTVVFSSRTIPGNEKAILEIKNRLIEQGIKIIEDSDALVHVSGHPRRSELRQMYDWVAAADRRAGAWRGRASGRAGLADGAQSGIPQVAQVRNGDMLRLAPGAAEIIDQVPFGRIYKDGRLIGDRRGDGHPRPAQAVLCRPCRRQRRARRPLRAGRRSGPRRDRRCRSRRDGRATRGPDARCGDRRGRKHPARSAEKTSTWCRKRCAARCARPPTKPGARSRS